MPGTMAQLAQEARVGSMGGSCVLQEPDSAKMSEDVRSEAIALEWWVRVLAALRGRGGGGGQGLSFPVCGSGGHLEGVLAGARTASGLAEAGGEGRAKPSAPALLRPEPALRARGCGGDDSMSGPRPWTLLCLGLLLPGGGAAWSVPGARFSGRR